MVAEVANIGQHEAGLDYYRSLATPAQGEMVRVKKLSPTRLTGTVSLPTVDLLASVEAWEAAIEAYCLRIGHAVAGTDFVSAENKLVAAVLLRPDWRNRFADG